MSAVKISSVRSLNLFVGQNHITGSHQDNGGYHKARRVDYPSQKTLQAVLPCMSWSPPIFAASHHVERFLDPRMSRFWSVEYTTLVYSQSRMQSPEGVKSMFDRRFVRVADNLHCHHASRAVQSRDQPITVTSLCREANEKSNVLVKNIRPAIRDVNLKFAIAVTAN